jgi:hypothetical protein
VRVPALLLEQLGPLLGQTLFLLETLSVFFRALPRLLDQLLLARFGEALLPPLRPVRLLLGLWLGLLVLELPCLLRSLLLLLLGLLPLQALLFLLLALLLLSLLLLLALLFLLLPLSLLGLLLFLLLVRLLLALFLLSLLPFLPLLFLLLALLLLSLLPLLSPPFLFLALLLLRFLLGLLLFILLLALLLGCKSPSGGADQCYRGYRRSECHAIDHWNLHEPSPAPRVRP